MPARAPDPGATTGTPKSGAFFVDDRLPYETAV